VLRLIREPLFHFALIGGLIFVLYSLIGDSRQAADDVINVSTARIDQLAAQYKSVWKRLPSERELDSLIEEHIREEVYYRGALKLGLERDDTVVRRRLRQKMEFLMDTGSYLQTPSDKVLKSYFADHEDDYLLAPRLAFEQVYFGTAADAQGVTRSLATLQADPEIDPREVGQPTLLPARLSLSPPTAIDGVFGKGFFERLVELRLGEWAGPVASGYGTHLIRVLEYLPAELPMLKEVRDAVINDWRVERAKQIRDEDYALRRARFVIEIEPPEPSPAEDR
jgi:hypothetical protein